jgi:hypothetical protein
MFRFFILILLFPWMLFSQSVPEHISNRQLYDFLDELAGDHLISLVSVVKPYARSVIAEKLEEADKQRENLSRRQQWELDRYLNEFALERDRPMQSSFSLIDRDTTFLWSIFPPAMTYRDSLFRFYLVPVLGSQYYVNENGTLRHTWGGIAVHSYVGKNIAVWANLRDNQQLGARLARPEYLVQDLGGNYKGVTGGGDGGEFSEMRGGIAWSWKWGTISFMKNHLSWGDNYHGANIFSGRTPSYAMIKLHMKPARWLDFNYHHGWLISEEIDSVLSYYPNPGDPLKKVYLNKYIAANMYTITPMKRLYVSIGNSVIYSEPNVRPEYLIPFLFYKSVVHTQTSGYRGHNHNSAFFINVSSRQIKYLHLYMSWFVDEFSVTRVGDDDRTNFTGTKAGFRLSNWPLRNVSLISEYTFTYPKTYQHRTPVTTYETNQFNLGHHLRDNARELYFALRIKPIAGLLLDISYAMAEKGNVVPYVYNAPAKVDEDPYMEEVVWRNNTMSIRTRYLFYNNFSLFAEYRISDIQGYDVDGVSAQEYLDMFTPGIFHGFNHTTTAGIQLGF